MNTTCTMASGHRLILLIHRWLCSLSSMGRKTTWCASRCQSANKWSKMNQFSCKLDRELSFIIYSFLIKSFLQRSYVLWENKLKFAVQKSIFFLIYSFTRSDLLIYELFFSVKGVRWLRDTKYNRSEKYCERQIIRRYFPFFDELYALIRQWSN